MADTSSTAASTASTPPSSAAEQARIRRERREAKIKAGGASRLNKITGLGGGFQRDPEPTAAPKVTPIAHADPEEVDISEHYYQPATTARIPPPTNTSQSSGINEKALRDMMLGFPPSPGATPGAGTPPNPFGGPFGAPGPNGGADQDPMAMLMQQMLGGAAGGMPSFPGMPPMNIPGMPGMPGMAGAEAQPAQTDKYAYLWRIVHALFALGLGLYVALSSNFTGSKVARDLGDGISGLQTFYIFATAEAMLQGTRFMLEKGRAPPPGILGMVLQFLPEPWNGYMRWVLRYSSIWQTTSADVMVCLFVLGTFSWWRGAV